MSYDTAVAAAIPGAPLRWKLDDTAGSTVARNTGAAGSACNGTASSPAMAGAAGLLGGGTAFRFVEASANVVSSAVAGNQISGLTSLALVLWFRYESASGNDFLIDATNSSVIGGVSVRKSGSNNLIANVQTSTGRALVSTASNTITANTRYCLALTWAAGSDVKLYLNGVRQTVNVSAGTINPGGTLVNPADLYLGKWKSGADTNYLQGWLDDITIGAAYLTDAQAVDLYNQGIVEAKTGTGSISAVTGLSSSGVKRGAGSISLGAAPELAGAAGRKAGAGTGTLTARATGTASGTAVVITGTGSISAATALSAAGAKHGAGTGTFTARASATASGIAERTPRDITIDFGVPAVDFHTAEPSTAWVGGMAVALYLPASTTEYVYVETAGAPSDITGNRPDVALVDVMADPIEADWHAAEWDPNRPATIRYLVTGYSRGRYALWVRVTDYPEAPVRRAGYVMLF